MKKTILLSLIVSSLVMGANTVDNLTINEQENQINTTTIDEARVHQGKTEVVGNSDVDDVTIDQDNTIEASTIESSYENNSPSVLQGLTKINDSEAKFSQLNSANTIKNVEVLNSIIEQGSFVMNESNITSTSANDIKITSTNIVEDSSVDEGLDINATEVKQSVITLLNGAKVKNLNLNYKNTISGTDAESTKIHQGILTINSSEVDGIDTSESGGYTNNLNSVLESKIIGGSVVQSAIYISENSLIKDLENESENTIENFQSENTNITQNKTTITDSHVSDFKTTQVNTIEGVIADGSYTGWANTSKISQGETTIN